MDVIILEKMEQIFMLEVFVKKIILKIEPPEKDEYELKLEEEERRREAEALAAAEAAAKGKKGKKGKGGGKGKKGKKGKEPPKPSEEEMKFMQTCTLQMNCLPLFDFYVAHDNFIPPPPPPPPDKKGKKGKKGGGGKKGKKGKQKVVPRKIILPSEPLPQPPYFGVGNSVMFISRPSKLEEVLSETPIYVTVWNRDEEFNCIGFCKVEWHESFFKCLRRSAELNPVNMDKGEFRDSSRPEMITNTIELIRYLQCEEDLKPSGEIDFSLRLTCLGNNVVSYFVALPEMERLPGRKYLNDDLKLKDVEVVRHWEGTAIEAIPPIAYFFGAPDITKEPIRPVEELKVFEEFVAPFTSSELAILAMGFPKGPCGGTNCPKRMDFRGSQHQFIYGEYIKGKYQHGSFVNKRDVHGPCGRLDCPLAKKVRSYLCTEGSYKPCQKPCPEDYY